MEAKVGDWFVPAQAEAWCKQREWAEEAEQNPFVYTQEGGSWDGPGASLSCTEGLRKVLPALLKRLTVESMLDAPCGDWAWMRLVDLEGIRYTGWDVDPERVLKCQRRASLGDVTGNPHTQFECVNLLTVESIPKVDLILCRDFLGHLTNGFISDVLAKFHKSRSRWLLASTYPISDNDFTYDPNQYAWAGYLERPVNLGKPPFNLEQIESIPEAPGPGGVLKIEHELGLFDLRQTR